MSGESSSEARRAATRTALRVWVPVIAITAIAFFFALSKVGPAPPRKVTLATGSPQGAYYGFGEAMAKSLGKRGLEVEVTATAGALENLERLESGAADLALVQGGTAPDMSETGPDEGKTGARSLASLFYEPLWIFHRRELGLEHLRDLRGKRVQVGSQGSGTRAVALELLAQNGIDDSNTQLLELSTQEALEQIAAGSLDAAFLVSSPESPAVRRLMIEERESVTLLDLDRSLAYERRYKFLRSVVLPEGALDLAANIPDRDHDLVAPTAALVASEDLHPAITLLVLQAAEEVFGPGGLFEEAGEFPSPLHLDLPLARSADRYFRSGPSFLFRVLPFWAAALAERLVILLLPLMTLALPLVRVAPPIIRWRTRSRIFRWYRDLQRLEQAARAASDPKSAQDCARQLEAVATEVQQVVVPLSYAEELYHLRLHLALVREELGLGPSPPPDPPPGLPTGTDPSPHPKRRKP